MSDSQFTDDLKILKDNVGAIAACLLAALGAHMVFASQGVARARVLGLVDLPAGIVWMAGAAALLAALVAGVVAFRTRSAVGGR